MKSGYLLLLFILLSEAIIGTLSTGKKYTLVYAPVNFKLTTKKSSLLPFVLLPFGAVQAVKDNSTQNGLNSNGNSNLVSALTTTMNADNTALTTPDSAAAQLYLLSRLIFRRRRPFSIFGRRRREEPQFGLGSFPFSPRGSKMQRFGLQGNVAGLSTLGDITECFLKTLCVMDAMRVNVVSVDIDRSYALKVFKAILDNPDSNVKFQFAHQLFDDAIQDLETNRKVSSCTHRYPRCQANINEMMDFYASRQGGSPAQHNSSGEPIASNAIH